MANVSNIKVLKESLFAKVNEELLQKLEKFEYDIMPVGDKYYDDDDYIRTQHEFMFDDKNNKWKINPDLPPQYYEVALLCSSREKEYKNVTIKVRVPHERMDIVDGFDVDDAVKIKFDRKLTAFETDRFDNLNLALYVSEMKEVGANA